MDPNANLATLRRLVDRIIAAPDLAGQDDAIELATLTEALDNWLSRGGFLPSEWQKGR